MAIICFFFHSEVCTPTLFANPNPKQLYPLFNIPMPRPSFIYGRINYHMLEESTQPFGVRIKHDAPSGHGY